MSAVMNTPAANVAEFLLAGKPPERIALQTIDAAHTYGDLSDGVCRVAAYLKHTGGAAGDRVILIGENSLFWVAAYLGALHGGFMCVPLPPSVSQSDLDYILNLTEARIVFADAAVALRSGRYFRNCHLVTDREVPPIPGAYSCCAFQNLPCDGVDKRPSPVGRGDDLAALMFTSGSTGSPRGVMVSHRNIIANTESIIEYLGLTAADRIMDVLPFHYCFGTSLLHTHLRVGGSLVVDSRFMYPEVVLQRMIETECTGFAGVPSHFQLLLWRSRMRERPFPHLRYVQQAGGHLAPAFVRALKESLPGTRVFVMYGQTEATARLSYLPPELLDEKSGSIGKGIPGVTLQVLKETGEPVSPSEVGEIVAQGDNVTHGYWRDPLESDVIFRNRKLYTGDLATVDSDGFIYVVGRSKDFLKCGGKRISCRQLEEQVLGCEAVMEAAIVPMPDPILGDAVKLFVVPREWNADDLEMHLRGYCKAHMLPQLVPKEIVILQSLPKNSAGKVLKESLKGRQSPKPAVSLV